MTMSPQIIGLRAAQVAIVSALVVIMNVLAPVRAADLPVKTAARPVAAVYNWSGFYIGGDAGGAWQRESGTSNYFQTFTGIDPSLVNNPQGNKSSRTAFVGGVHAGYNWQMSQLVVGVEADIDWTNVKRSFCRQTDIQSLACADVFRGFLTFTEKAEWIGSARGRLGYAFDRFLVYGTGGAAFGKLDTTISASCLVGGCGGTSTLQSVAGSFSNNRVGWVAGAGFEALVDASWIVRAEYLHYDLGTVTNSLGFAALSPGLLPATISATWSRGVTYDVVRAGLSYKFGGPVVAKY